MQATHTAARHTGSFVSSDHRLHLHHKEQEDTESMPTHCRSASDRRSERFKTAVQSHTLMLYPSSFLLLLCKHIDSQKNTMSLHYVQSVSLQLGVMKCRKRNIFTIKEFLPVMLGYI